jgi:hypothetical protein
MHGGMPWQGRFAAACTHLRSCFLQEVDYYNTTVTGSLGPLTSGVFFNNTFCYDAGCREACCLCLGIALPPSLLPLPTAAV